MKKYIIGLIFGIVLTLGGVVIAENLNASEIDYNDTTVEGALNDLYTEAGKDIFTRLNLSSDKVTTTEDYGIRIPNRQTTLNLGAGTYLILVSYVQTGGGAYTSNVGTTPTVVLNDNNECTTLVKRKIQNFITPFGGANSNTNLEAFTALASFICKFDNNKELIIDSNSSVTESTYQASQILAQAIKLD